MVKIAEPSKTVEYAVRNTRSGNLKPHDDADAAAKAATGEHDEVIMREVGEWVPAVLLDESAGA